MAKKYPGKSRDIAFSMCLEEDPAKERHFLYTPAKRQSGVVGTYRFQVVEKGKRAQVLLNILGRPEGMTVTPGRYKVFSRKDTERALGLIGDAIANRISAATAPQL